MPNNSENLLKKGENCKMPTSHYYLLLIPKINNLNIKFIS